MAGTVAGARLLSAASSSVTAYRQPIRRDDRQGPTLSGSPSRRIRSRQPDTDDTRALQGLNDRLHRDERVDLALLPFSDGLTLARKR